MEQIGILIHRQSIVHSMVDYKDGSIIAQLGIPDMIIPIAYALSYPHHLVNDLPRLELDKIGMLSFEKPDLERFKCLALALEAAKVGGSLPIVLNASNEIAVASFLSGKIRFLDIPSLIERCLEMHRPSPIEDIEVIMEVDHWTRQAAEGIINEKFKQ
jgi:1-deoxy-D-xylulose-5-phosphate reductoisomerase